MALPVDSRPLPGEPLALDLLNTVFMSGGASVDALARTSGVERWLAVNGLPGGAGDATRDALIEARDAIRGVVTAGEPEERRRLDAVLDRGRIRVGIGDDGAITRLVDVDDAAWSAAVGAALSLVDLLESAPERIRRCDHPNCVLWFFDTTRNGTRRWCSMAGCGNRAKAQRHYERIRPR